MFLGTLKGQLWCFIGLGPYKSAVFIDVELATKNSEAHCDIALQPWWRYSHGSHCSSNNRWSIATNLQKYYFLCHTPPCGTRLQRYSTCLYNCGVGRVSILSYQMGCSTLSQRTSEFLVAHSSSKKTPHFLGPKRCK
jgi:hypothetical protein